MEHIYGLDLDLAMNDPNMFHTNLCRLLFDTNCNQDFYICLFFYLGTPILHIFYNMLLYRKSYLYRPLFRMGYIPQVYTHIL